MNIPPLNAAQPVVDEKGSMLQRMRSFVNAVARLSILEGTGSPEGVVEARATRLYMDTSGTASNIMYVKQVSSISGDKKAGWILV